MAKNVVQVYAFWPFKAAKFNLWKKCLSWSVLLVKLFKNLKIKEKIMYDLTVDTVEFDLFLNLSLPVSDW